ncbi:hypothetical protein [Deinococcus apachensis]|uniref:hypothetical protein n=1 Tax=Deinococcus apachensis TaxID=309886 RepID=UPI00037EBB8D|nr:hypothetical protein [Deinococcus apachensis]
MTRPAPATLQTPAPVSGDLRTASLLLAAEAVLAHLYPRAPLRLDQVSLGETPGVTYALAPDPQALALNRGLREEVALVALAGEAMARLLGIEGRGKVLGRDARVLLASALRDPEELEVLDAQLAVLEARARALLRRSWAEVEVVAAGLHEHGTLDAQAVAHRIACAQGIRGTLLN